MAFTAVPASDVLPDKVAKASTISLIKDDLDDLDARDKKREALIWALGE